MVGCTQESTGQKERRVVTPTGHAHANRALILSLFILVVSAFFYEKKAFFTNESPIHFKPNDSEFQKDVCYTLFGLGALGLIPSVFAKLVGHYGPGRLFADEAQRECLELTIKEKEKISVAVNPNGMEARYAYNGKLHTVTPGEGQSFISQSSPSVASAGVASADLRSIEGGQDSQHQSNGEMGAHLNPPQFNVEAIIGKIEEQIDSQVQDKVGKGPGCCR